jgi:superfamily II DNA or RNA helicase
MGFELRDYQLRAMEALRESVAQRVYRIVLQSPTGSGKTALASAIADGCLRKGNRLAFVVPAISLIDQTVEMFRAAGVTDIGVIQQDHELTWHSAPIQICSIQTLQARRWIPECSVAVFDEVHQMHKWHLEWLSREEWQKRPIFGLSATPWTKGLGRYFATLLVVATTKDMIEQGILSPFKVFSVAAPDLSKVRTVAGDYHEGELAEAMDDHGKLTADIVETWQKRWGQDKTLCFAVNLAHARQLHARFTTAGVTCAYQDGSTPADERTRIRESYTRGETQVIVSVGTLTTGVDLDVRCISLCRPTRSEMLFCLDTETEVLTSHGWRGVGQVKRGDCAAALVDEETGRGCWSPVVATLERDMAGDEQWVSYEAPRANFRVTGDHTMIFRADRTRRFRRASALEMAGVANGVQTPSAIEIEQSGLPLTDAELYFIGMMMTDGTWNSTRGSISQSERHPEVMKRIEQCLRDCGIGYAKRRVSSPPLNAAVAEVHRRWRYNFSAGKPKAHKVGIGTSMFATRHLWESIDGITGYRHLLPFMDKDFAPALMALSRRQFLTLLQGIHDGDGIKMKSPSIDWTPRSWTLCSGRKAFIERLQALAAINGFTSHLRSEQGSRKNPIWILTITPQSWRNIGGVGKRPQIVVSPATAERVWCVETAAGTIVTRRRGKVTVMGNCQMVGRGLRKAPGKDFLLLLDHTTTTERLGFVTDIHYDRLDDGRRKRETKVRETPLPTPCEQCGFLPPKREQRCSNCGFSKPQPVSDRVEGIGELVEWTAAGSRDGAGAIVTPAAAKRDFYAQLLWVGRARSYKDGWAAVQFKERFGEWPPWGWVGMIEPVAPGPLVLSWVRYRMIRYAKAKRAGQVQHGQLGE